ncbi:MAG: hypothetical protein WBC19_07510 [Pyrinomonadaceae bacterium]|nr:hypothetical protein [Chloracidobacterium sp.]
MKVLVSILACIGLGSIVVLGNSPKFVGDLLESVKGNPIAKVFFTESKSESQKPAVANGFNIQASESVPDEIVYFILFNHLVSLKEQAQVVAARGESLDYFKLYEDQAALTNSQSQLLFQTAQDCMDATAQIDQQAKDIIVSARRNFPNGEMQSPEDIPAPPKELKGLQQQKNDVVLQFRDVLRDGLGEVTFNQFNEFARQKIAPQVTMNLTNQGGK